MAAAFHAGRGRRLGQAASVAGIVALSVLTTLGIQHLLAPTQAAAQAGAVSEVRASAFVLVGADGTVIGRLGPGSQGAGNLTLFDPNGRLRIAVSGAGDLLAYGTGGTALAQLYADADSNASGLTLRGPDGKTRVDVGQSPENDGAAMRVRDGDGNPRVGIGALADASGGNSGDYGLRVRDASGDILTTLP